MAGYYPIIISLENEGPSQIENFLGMENQNQGNTGGLISSSIMLLNRMDGDQEQQVLSGFDQGIRFVGEMEDIPGDPNMDEQGKQYFNLENAPLIGMEGPMLKREYVDPQNFGLVQVVSSDPIPSTNVNIVNNVVHHAVHAVNNVNINNINVANAVPNGKENVNGEMQSLSQNGKESGILSPENSRLMKNDGSDKLECRTCQKTFGTEAILRAHLLTHKKSARFSCKLCNKKFAQGSSLIVHMKRHEGKGKNLRASIANQVIDSWKLPNREKNPMKEEEDSGSRLNVEGSYLVKTEVIIEDGEIKVNGIFNGHDDGDTSHSELMDMDTIDGGIGEGASSIKTEKKPKRQGEPGKSPKIKKSRPFECGACPERFKVKDDMLEHRETHGIVRDGKVSYDCDICGKQLARFPNLLKHRKTHQTDDGYTCNVCGRSFAKACVLKKHVETHSEDLPFKCDHCGQKFRKLPYLKVHLRIHTGEKPFSCDICQERFHQPNNLARHRRKHTGEKPYQCKVCNKQFTQRSNLTLHEKKHSHMSPEEIMEESLD